MSEGPKFERAQVVSNLRTGFRSILRSYYLGLQEMGFRGAEGVEVLREALWEEVRQELGNPPRLGPCDSCGKRRVFPEWGEETCLLCTGKEKR